MRNMIIYIFFFTFILTMELTLGRNDNKIKNLEASHKKHKNIERLKRSLDDNNLLLWTKNKKILHGSPTNSKFDERTGENIIKNRDIEKDIPFWGSRGRRDTSSLENYFENAMPFEMKLYDKLCENCFSGSDTRYKKKRRDENDNPFWGSRGRRNSDAISSENMGETAPFWDSRGRGLNDAFLLSNRGTKQDPLSNFNRVISESIPFWGNRGRREGKELFWGQQDVREEYDPFWDSRERREENGSSWGSRGRREESEPFWGSRGRREENEPFWGSRGRREENEPFWGSRGRREESEPFWGSRGRREESEPFWGSRGKREESGPFWGSRGKRDESEPFWRSRGRREDIEPFRGIRGREEETDPFWEVQGKRLESHEDNTHPRPTHYNLLKDNLKQSIKNAIEAVENDIIKLSSSVWTSMDKNRHISLLSNEDRNRHQPPNKIMKSAHLTMNRPSESNTVLDDRVYAEQPSYIIVERSGRSSAEDDPYFISRGKKKIRDLGVAQAVRDRRGVIEELVKTVQNDPYFIARGKKDSSFGKIGNISTSNTDLTKDLSYSTAEFILNKNKGHNIFKREIPDNERSRRTTLKKLADQLQMDPYFVSRGKKKKVDDSDANNFHEMY